MEAVGGIGELKESWAAERRRDNLIDRKSKCVGGETEKLEGWEMNKWRTNLDLAMEKETTIM